MSLYLQISDPGSSSSKWDCFASYQLAVRNLADDTKSVRRDSWHRFSAKKRSHGWCDFAALTTLLDAKQGFLGPGGIIQVSTDITILDESVSFTRESDLGGNISLSSTDVFSGKFVWRVQNFSVFQPLLRTQKIMSPAFPAGDCALRMSVYQSTVGGSEFLSVCLESKDTEKTGSTDRTCWCLFRLAVQPQSEDGGKVVHRDSYGRFAFDSRSGDNTSLGWNDFMKLSDFTAPEAAYLVGDTAVFSTSFHVIRETSSLVRYVEPRGALAAAGAPSRLRDKRKSTNHRESEWTGRFQWRLENFTRLKDLLKKRKITGLCIKSRRFSVGGKDCRLIVYPRGQSQPPTFLSVFLEVTDPAPASPDWTCFVSHRLSVVNQRGESERSIAKESQNRYSKTAKDWGWREFVSLTTLFDADAGFLVNDAVVFSAEVLVLKESSETKVVPLPGPIPAALEAPPAVASPAPAANGDAGADANGQEGEKDAAAAVAVPAADSKVCFAWRVENFGVFKDVVETRKIFSQFFNAGPCDVRVGLYESFDSLCVYLESDAAVTPAPPPPAPGTPGNGTPAAPEKPPSYWVRYRAAIMNQKAPEKTQWREGSVYTRSWNNSVLQFPRMATSPDSGRVLRDSLLVAVEILEVKPWSQDTTETAVVDANTSAQSGAVGQSTGGADHGATAARRARPSGDGSSTEADSDSLGSDIDDDDDDDSAIDDDDDELESGLAADMEVEDALARWLLAAGLDLVGGIDEHPPVLADVSSVQKLLEDMLTRQNGALPMFTASLRMYMSSLTRVKRLLLPSLMTSPDFGDIYGVGPAVMTVLAGVPSMQPHLLSMLVDVMLDHTLTAKMHRHLFSDNHDAEGTAGSGSDAPAVVEGGPSASPDEVPAAAVPVKAPRTPTAQDAQLAAHGAPADAATNGVLDSGNGVIDIYIPTTEEADETLGIILGWMRSIGERTVVFPGTCVRVTGGNMCTSSVC